MGCVTRPAFSARRPSSGVVRRWRFVTSSRSFNSLSLFKRFIVNRHITPRPPKARKNACDGSMMIWGLLTHTPTSECAVQSHQPSPPTLHSPSSLLLHPRIAASPMAASTRARCPPRRAVPLRRLGGAGNAVCAGPPIHAQPPFFPADNVGVGPATLPVPTRRKSKI